MTFIPTYISAAKRLRKAMRYAAVAIVATALFSGCSSSRNASQGGNSDAAAVVGLSPKQHYELFTKQCRPWTEINAPLKLELKAPAKLSASGRIYMRRDKDVYISIRVLGIEAVSLYANADSLYFVDKMGKRYVAEDIKDALNGAHLSITDIQDLLLGRLFSGDSTNGIAPGKITIDNNADTWSVAPLQKNRYADVAMNYSCRSNQPKSLEITVDGTKPRELTCLYADPANTTNGLFMQRISIATVIDKQPLDATLTIEMTDAKWTVSNSIGWKQPKNYKRVSLESLSKSLSF